MSPPVRLLLLMAGPFVASCWPLARAQTIADYSHAQRALLEATLSQSAARASGLAAPPPPTATSTAPIARPTEPRRSAEIIDPVVEVAGVFVSSTRSIVEVDVRGAAFLLAAGQDVPGTPWRVDVIAAGHVVLSRRDPRSPGGDEKSRRTTVAFPTLR
jgi:hypothetical protein